MKDAKYVNMADQIIDAPEKTSRPAEQEAGVRRGVELLYFGYSHLTRGIDAGLAEQGLGRAHHRSLYFIARFPDLTVGDLLRLLAITKQSLGRVLNDLVERGLVEARTGASDRRQKLLRLTDAGVDLEADLFNGLRERLLPAYAGASEDDIQGFWRVLEGLVPEEDRTVIVAMDSPASH